MKQYGSFSKVEDRFSFETSNLKNKRFCFITTATYLDLKCYKWKLRRGGVPKCNHATTAKSFIISKKVKSCPHVNGALSLNLFCDELANSKETVSNHFSSLDPEEESIVKYNKWTQMGSGEEYTVLTNFGNEEGAMDFSFLELCRANGKLTLGSIPSKLPVINCKAYKTLILRIFKRNSDSSRSKRHPAIIPLPPCEHEEPCTANREAESSLRDEDPNSNGRTGNTAGNPTINMEVEGNDHNISGGNDIGRDATFNIFDKVVILNERRSED